MLNQEMLLDSTESYLKSLFAETLVSLSADFDSSAPFGELGIDSFRVLKVIKALEADFGTLPKTLLFENFSVDALARYFVDKHGPTLAAKFSQVLPSFRPEAIDTPAKPVAKVVAGTPVKPTFEAAAPPTTDVVKVYKHATKHAPVQEPKQIICATRKTPVRLLEKDLPQYAELDVLVNNLFEQHKNEGCVSRGTRNIAPNLFIGSARKGYLNYSRSNDIVLVYAYTGPEDYFAEIAKEMHQYCVDKNCQLNIFVDKAIASIGDVPFSATPFGALQRVLNIQNFTLEGGAMRRLRYQVAKFEKVGECRTQEYKCGTDKVIDENIAAIIDKWCETKTMVNPLIHIVKDEILAGTLHPQHRIFLTYLDDVLQNVILISAMCREFNGYLMDLEFYPDDMPLGGLEYGIVRIIETLAAEGCDMFSLGGTYGCRLTTSENADPEVDKILDELHKQNIFNDESNLQFKNKFRPENRTIYICRPVGSGKADNIIDIIMMIADPAKAQTSDEENYNVTEIIDEADIAGAQSIESNQASVGTSVIEGSVRSRTLSDFGFNPLNIASEQIEFDLKTDSWAQLESAFVDKQMRHLRAQLQQPVNLNDGLKAVFPFKYFVLTDAGRTSDSVFCKAWPKKGIVLQNLLFPTCIYHQIDKGFTPYEIPRPEVFQLDSNETFKGNLSWDVLQEQVTSRSAEIAYVCIEVSDNAAGGHPVSTQHLRQVKALLAKHAIPLVIDSTRVLENARAVIEFEPEHAGKTIWEAARAILSYADVVIGSLAKNFCVNKGGIIATNDEMLLRRFQDVIQHEGGGLDVIDKKLIALSLDNRKLIETQVLRRMEAVKSIWEALKAQKVPVAYPAGGHCILIDVKRIAEFEKFENPVPSFVAWLYLNTGIRAGAHSVGMQKDTALNGLVRLAIPVGLKPTNATDIANRLVRLFNEKINIPELGSSGASSESYGDVHANYALIRYHNLSGAIVANKTVVGHATVNKVTADSVATDVAMAQVSPAMAMRMPESVSVITPTIDSRAPAQASFAAVQPLQPQAVRSDIAIVGMAGRYPKAKNLFEFWENLRQGRDCVGDIPEERMSRRVQNELTRRYRGGFLDDIDKFDSLFFNISPREAEALDPQERLFLEVAWEAIEDAGYYPEILGQTPEQDNAQRSIGVFVGAVWGMYQIVGVEEKLSGNNVSPNSFLWSIANRVSYWMNLTGPSLTVDTACSSSLTALCLACESIYNGNCSSAIVGGVNLDLHQHKFDINWAGGALSSDGVCRSFGAGANGYVAGEGVGAILIKPLQQALEDKDNIYGVIKSAVVNHGGRTSGYTVPNPKAQGDLVATAFKKAGVDPRSIGYIEAHGTGTELGDPVELSGLSNVFEGVGNHVCPIGSVKTNIGHLEAAAGVVGVCKVLLQMRYGQLVPSLHSAQLNKHIDFDNSPFYVQQQLQDWKGKEIDGIKFPLRAGISSFGAGGANAHIVIEKYDLPSAEETPHAGVYVFPLSAKNDDQLREMALRLRTYLELDFVRHNLNDIAFTLQNGRKSFEHRFAILAKTKKELIKKLRKFLDGDQNADVLSGHAKNSEGITKLLSRKEKEQFVALLSQSRDPYKLAQLWIDGLLSDCRGFSQADGRRTSLPTYPFADKRHWIGIDKTASKAVSLGAQVSVHPLIDSNESTFQRQLFKKTFREQEFFLCDHLVSGIPTLPGVAYLDAVRKAGEIAAGRKVQKIRNVTWVSPLSLEGSSPIEALIELKPSADSVGFEVFSEGADGKRKLYSQGKLVFASEGAGLSDIEYIDIAAIRARSSKTIAGKDAYPLFKSVGLNYGPSFQVLQEVYKNDDEVLGLLKLPDVRNADFDQFVLHPSLLDAAMQAGVIALLGEATGEMKVPYSLGEVEILYPLTPTCYSYITKSKVDRNGGSGLSKENVTITDETGKVLARIRESVGVPLTNVHAKSVLVQEEEFDKLYYAHVWQQSPLAQTLCDVSSVLIFDTDEHLHRTCIKRNIDAVLVLPRERFMKLGENAYGINPKDRQDYTRLFESLNQKSWVAKKICYAWPDATEPQDQNALQNALDRSAYAFLYVCQALIEQKLKGRVQLLYLYFGTQDGVQAHNEAINGFTRSLRLENPKIDCKVLELRQSRNDLEFNLDSVLAELHSAAQNDITIRYDDRIRYARVLEKVDVTALESAGSPGIALKQNGVYLITGGAGGLGLIFAEYLAKQCKAKLVLTGRSSLSAEREAQLDVLRNLGAEVLYLAADVSKREDAQQLVSEAKAKFGALNGIIHSAGVLRDSFLRNKTYDEMEAVFAPKIYGTFHLDELTQNEGLDFFVLFSSLAAVGGNAGQCDYAFANHYMDSFAIQRELLRASGKRTGKTLSINWSLWADGGMALDEQTMRFFKKNLGIVPLRTEVGLEAFTNGLLLAQPQIAVLEGVQAKIETAWGMNKEETTAKNAPPMPSASVGIPRAKVDPTDVVITALSEKVIEMLKISADDLSLDSILLDLGFDSIGLATFANVINEKYHLDINPVLFFEYPSIRAIAGVLATEYKSAIEKVHGDSSANSGTATVTEPTPSSTQLLKIGGDGNSFFAINKGWEPPAALPTSVGFKRELRFVNEPIAIVGIGGSMPQSSNVEEFWDNLKNARNLVTDIPRDRWIWEDYDGNPIKEVNKSNSKWGGFMKEVDKFDPLFFGITPREAEMMDPQQRIFIETVWSAIEDSGHKVSDLSGTKTGLFVGASAKDYIDVLAEHQVTLDGFSASGNSHSILANRVSFLLNLRGPSAPLDTACSSSLIALHRAIESIHTGSSDMAIVGGVQVMLTPVGHISLSSAGMLSTDGKCKTFDKDANGYVRGEGSGAVFLKTLAKAEEDGNPIYAIVKSTAENHGGRVTMLTAPNPKAQAELLFEAYEKAQIDPTTVGYIECHGTGTSLGDPIEIQALKKSFSDLYNKHNKSAPAVPHCGLSSVKTNIGHLEPAAGIASLLKVLLSIKHKQIPALLHFEEINPYIDLRGTPFYIVDKTKAWDPIMGQDGVSLPRRAGVSSFGWGGANAHVVLEEYIPQQRQAFDQAAQLIVLSAKSADRLNAYAASLLAHIGQNDVELADLAYTLQRGRDPMQERLALIVVSVAELAEKLGAYVAGETVTEGLYRGRVARGKQNEQNNAKDINGTLNVDERLAKLANNWVTGSDVDWSMLHPRDHLGKILCRRISLPTYPFARERYWIQAPEKKESKSAATVSVLHSPEVGSLLAYPKWEATPVSTSAQRTKFQRHVVVLCDLQHLDLARLKSVAPDIDAHHLLSGSTANAAQRYNDIAIACFERVQSILKAKSKVKTLLQVVVSNDGQHVLLAGLAGLFKTARMESPNLFGQVVLSAAGDEKALAEQLNDCRARPDESLFKYDDKNQCVLRWYEHDARQQGIEHIVFRDDGIYLITGGLGGLGTLFAKEIIRHTTGARIFFTGRSALTEEKRDSLAALCAALSVSSDQLMYRQLDLNKVDQVEALVADIVNRFGALNGVIHSAGTTRDNMIINKTRDDFADVLAPKVIGTFNLDAATCDVDLDFLVLFSSVSAVLGNVGQADYTVANGFMDQFASYRNQQVNQKRRRGQTLSINWPLWEEGGMQVDAKRRAMLLKMSGMLPMRTQTGAQAFHRGLTLQGGQVLVMEGHVERLKTLLFADQPADEPTQMNTHTSTRKREHIASAVAKIQAEKLRALVLADLRSFQTRGM